MNILVTGGTSGLGKSIVHALAHEVNNKVYFTYASNQEVAEVLCGEFPNVVCLKTDFTNAADVDQLVATLPQWQLDVLINNAWVGSPNGTYFHKTPVEDFSASFRYNVLPLIKITQACIQIFRKQKRGKIVNVITSYVLDLPPMGFSVYSATKAYILQLSKCWCKENQRFNITSNCVLPDYMDTGFGHVDERITEQMKAEHPLRRLLSPEEVADVVAFLARASSQVNGISLPVTAGQHIL